jgi:hypothetical protein
MARLVAYALAGSLAMAAAPPLPPLTNEDIVRMVAGGTPEQEILESIRERQEAFDLNDDMVEELKVAGVPASVVAAMRSKRAESAPAPPPPARPKAGHTTLVVSLNPGGTGVRTLRLPAWADEDVKERLKLPKETDQRQVKDVAVFLACTSTEHVPDLWRSKTPLGRDMVSVVRHEMLVFVAGDTPEGKSPRVTLPARIEADVDATEPHNLVLGVAARIGDRWLQVASGALPKATIVPGQKPIVGRIERSGGGFGFNVELTAPK